jgi:hypothetical protein
MNWKLVFAVPVALALFVPMGGTAFAGTVRITDLFEGTPTVQAFSSAGVDITATNISILRDSSGEFLHFTFTSVDQTFANSFSRSRDLLESDGSFSDRLLVVATAAGSSVYDIKFASDPNTTAVGTNLIDPTLAEDGTSQRMFDITTVGGTQPGVDLFFVQSDVDTVPEPSSLALTLSGLSVLIVTLLGAAKLKTLRSSLSRT